jgi:hypothetical protein
MVAVATCDYSPSARNPDRVLIEQCPGPIHVSIHVNQCRYIGVNCP